MKNWLLLLTVILSHSINSDSQSLGKERVERLRKSVVRVITRGGTGTAFFVRDNGALITCWHVVSPAVTRDKKTNQITAIDTIYIVLNNGSRYEAEIYPYYLSKGYVNALVYDYCLLLPKNIPKSAFQTLKVGKFSDINDGDELYSCGYPLNMKQQFISKGILSTKYKDTILGWNAHNDTFIHPRELAILDITLNHGNSGGPIIKLADKPENDEVIGIADFIITPYGEDIKNVTEQSLNAGVNLQTFDAKGNVSMSLMGNIALISEALSNSSVGISGCVSIDYFLHER